jgi:hypothetical protein
MSIQPSPAHGAPDMSLAKVIPLPGVELVPLAKEPAPAFNVGGTADVEGLRVTLSNAHQVKDSGQNFLCADVAYDNQSSEQRSFNPLSWEVQGGDNVITMSTLRLGALTRASNSARSTRAGRSPARCAGTCRRRARSR